MKTKILLFFIGFFFLPFLAHSKKKLDIHVYPTYMAQKRVGVSGRILLKSRYIHNKKVQSKWKIFMRSVRRFTRKPAPNIPLQIRFQNQIQKVTSDPKGYFSTFFLVKKTATTLPVSRPSSNQIVFFEKSKEALQKKQVQIVEVSTTLTEDATFENSHSFGTVVSERSQGGLSIISDIDDTLIRSNIKSKLNTFKTFFLKGYDKVEVFEGALAFLQSIQKAPSQRGGGLIHYVSGSPVNLFDRIQALFQLRQFPLGSMHLKYLSGNKQASLNQQTHYKLSSIRPIFRHFPKRKFFLLGDSTEHDAEVYLQLQKEYPSQVKAIFIHNITKEKKDLPRFKGVFLFENYKQAQEEAKKRGMTD